MASLSAMRVGVGLFLALGAAIAGCAGKPPGDAPAPPTVTVSLPLQRDVTDFEVYTGRTAAVDSVQVRARVTGYLQEFNIQDGEEVKEGAVLCEIDPRPYQATFDAAKSQLAQNQASLELAKQNNQRFQDLYKTNPGAVSQLDLDKFRSAEDQAVAALNQSKANLETARLNLHWTKVTAPVSGQVSYKLVTRGNLITADQTVLTSIVSQDPIWVYFNVDEPTVVRLRHFVQAGKMTSKAGGKMTRVPLALALTGEKDFAHEGYVDFANNQLDQATATLLVRGVLPNPTLSTGERLFLPAMFVRVRLQVGTAYPALLVSQAAVGADQDLQFVYVVDEQNQVVRRPVELGPQREGLRAIKSGLQPKERVIVNGVQQVHPGLVVNPAVVAMPRPPTSALSPSAAPKKKAAAGPTQ